MVVRWRRGLVLGRGVLKGEISGLVTVDRGCWGGDGPGGSSRVAAERLNWTRSWTVLMGVLEKLDMKVAKPEGI